MCASIHKTLVDEFNFGMIWGRSAKHNPQRVGLAHQLQDEDVLEVVKLTQSQQRSSANYAARCQASYDLYKAGKKKKRLMGAANLKGGKG